MGLGGANGPLQPNDHAALFQRTHAASRGTANAVALGVGGAAAGGATFGSSAAPAQRIEPSFNCALAATETERAICASPQLAALDLELSRAWRAAGGPSNATQLADQRSWLVQRDACGGDGACLSAQLSSRVVALGGSVEAAQRTVAAAGLAGGALAPGQGAALLGPSAGLPLGPGHAASQAAGGALAPQGLGLAPSAGLPLSRTDFDAPETVHLAQGQLLRAPDGIEWRLELEAIRLDPNGLTLPMAEALYFERLAAQDPDAAQIAQAAFRDLNVLDQDDRRMSFRRALIAEAERLPEVSPDAPVPLVLYVPTSMQAFEEGQGIRLYDRGTARASLGPFDIAVGARGLDVLPATREQAKALLDGDAAQRADGQRLYQVLRGRITRLGVDETIESFANRTSGGRRLPSTFELESASLHYLPMRDARTPMAVTPASAALHLWSLGQDGTTAGSGEGGIDALALAASLGMRVTGGHVQVSLDGQTEGDWARFNALAYLGAHPDWVREDDNFAAVAALLLENAQRRAFFGEGVSVQSYAQLGVRDAFASGSSIASVFPDEFARRDAERVFLESYYPAIEGRVPRWPLPVLTTTTVALGEYDFENQRYPLSYQGIDGAQRGARIARLPVRLRGGGAFEGIYSAERFANLPEHLPMSVDQARALRQAAPQGRLTLAWWSDLDWSVDLRDLESRFAGGRDPGHRVGRATLKRIAIFADPALTQVLQEFDAASLLVSAPEPTGEGVGPGIDATLLASVEPADNLRLIEAVVRQLGDETIRTRIAQAQHEVQNANEFEVDDLLGEIEAQIAQAPEGPFWLRGSVNLGIYDRGDGAFGLAEARERGYTWRAPVGNRAEITVSLLGETIFAPLPVDEGLARRIVEDANRTVSFLVQVVSEAATDNSDERSRNQRYDLMVRPQRVIFFMEPRRREEAPTVLGQRSYGDANAAAEERLARRFEPKDFAGLAETRLPFTRHILDLIGVASGSEPSDDALGSMMAETWLHEARGLPAPGPSFFDKEAGSVPAAEVAVYRPSFESFLRAKAAALGDRFSIDVTPESEGEVCAGPYDPSQGYRALGGAARAALPLYAEQADSVRRAAGEARGEPFSYDTRYLVYNQRIRGDGNGCAPWQAVLVLSDGIHEGTQNAAEPIRIDFERTSVDVLEDGDAAPAMVVRARAEATRLLQIDGTVGKPILPTSEDTPPPTTAVAAMSEPADPTPAPWANVPEDSAVEAVDPAAPDPVSVWPELTGIEPAKSDRDLLGASLGQSMAAAHEALSALGGVEMVLETAEPNQDGPNPLDFQRVYVRRGGAEVIVVASFAPEGPVLGLLRRMVARDGVLPHDRIEAAMRDKFGPPTGDLSEHEGLFWGGAAGARCAVIPYGYVGVRRLQHLDGSAVDLSTLPEGLTETLSFGIPRYSNALLAGLEGCGETMTYVRESALDWGASGFHLLIVDLASLDAVGAALWPQEAGAGDFEIEF